MKFGIVELGHFSLAALWLLTVFGIGLGIVAGRKRSETLYQNLRYLCIATGILGLISLAALAYAFLVSDFTNQYVWQHSNRAMLPMYKFTAIWGGMDGSMLLWAVILGVNVSLVAIFHKHQREGISPWTLTILLSAQLFFFTVTLFFTNPFRYLVADFIPPDGNGLNPLLQNPYMAIHPPMLYLGFTTFTVPYAFCMGALLSGTLTNVWIEITRRWTLIAWGFLTAGIVLGGHWAYLELGWGGFWAWDPVENASFFPWLTGTAFLHSVMVQKRKGMLKLWNVWLVTLTYGLTVFGTFLTRSGVVESVHAFAATDVGWVFLVYLALLFGLALILTIYRRKELRSERKFESYFSREAAFLLNNLLFLSICFATIWGVMFPVLSEAVTGTKQAVGIPYFNQVNVPLFLALIFLMAVGPMIAWRKATWASIKKAFLRPFILAVIVSVLLVFAGIDSFYATLSYGLCWFVASTILIEMYRAYKLQKVSSELVGDEKAKHLDFISRHHVRYAGYLVHFGVVVMTIGITASMAHKTEQEFFLAKDETHSIGAFNFKLQEVAEQSTDNYTALVAKVNLSSRATAKDITQLQPEIRQYFKSQESTTEVALRIGLLQDVYIILMGLDDSGKRAAFKVYLNPLQVWLWIGTLIVLLGTGLALIPEKRVAIE